MPTRMLTEQDDFNSYKDWLDQNLVDENSIVPHIENIPDTLTAKGIYFWFLDSREYARLCKYIQIDQLPMLYQRLIGPKVYDLVYVGTAGTSKNQGSNLGERLRWHIEQSHSKSSVCSGALSTLRTGLSALIAEDLIIDGTEDKINQLLSDCFRVYFLSYSKDQESDINNDEKLLIKGLMPLLNIKNNSNARTASPQNPTKDYRVRRNEIISATRGRLGCINQDNETNKTQKYMHQVIKEEGNCIEFTVSSNQSIHDVIQGVKGLPEGICTFCMYNSKGPSQYLFKWKSGKPDHKTGSRGQNIYSYFKNVASNSDNTPRWKLIQKEMELKKVDEITVKVIPLKSVHGSDENSKSMTSTKSSKNKRPPSKEEPLSSIKWESMRGEKKLLLLPCSNAKQPGGNHKNTPSDYFQANHLLSDCRAARLIDYNGLLGNDPTYFTKPKRPGIATNAAYFQMCLNQPISYREAIHRYNGTFYGDLNRRASLLNKINNSQLHLLIISGLYGVLKYNDDIPDYHLEMKKGNPNGTAVWTIGGLNSVNAAVSNYIKDNEIREENVFYHMTSNEYLNALNPMNTWHDLGQQNGMRDGRRLDYFLNNLL